MASNGRLPASALAPIPGGQLSKPAAAAWNAGPAKAGLRPLGPNSSYRNYAGQVYYWNLWKSGRGNLAAVPGTSNHGLGIAVDLKEPWMRTWINQHGARYGWRKVEAPGEWWHVNYVGGFRPPADPYRALPRHERALVEKLRYHSRGAAIESRSGKGPRYKAHIKWRDVYRDKIRTQMNRLAADSRATGKGGWEKDNRGGRYQALGRALKNGGQ